jgi:hypothetical protein
LEAKAKRKPLQLQPANENQEPPASGVLPPHQSAPASDKRRGRPFERGQSGNPSGRPKGSRNRVTKVVEGLHDHSEALVAKAVETALAGDSAMLGALVSTLVPRSRDEAVQFDLPEIETANDARTASSAVLAACGRGELSPNEAREVMALISSHMRTMEVADIAARLTVLEGRLEREMSSFVSENTQELEERRIP